MEIHFAKLAGSFCSIIIINLKKFKGCHCQNLLQQDVLALVVMDITSLKLRQCLMALFAL